MSSATRTDRRTIGMPTIRSGALRDRLEEHAGRPCVYFRGRGLTFGDIALEAHARGAAVEHGTVQAVMLSDPLESYLHIWSAILQRRSVVLLPTMGAELASHLARIAGATRLLLDGGIRNLSSAESMRAGKATTDADGPAGGNQVASGAPPTLAHLSSGTTGAVRWVYTPHEHLLECTARHAERFSHRYENQVALLTMPLAHSYGLSLALEYAAAGSAIVLPDPETPFGPLGLLFDPALAQQVTAIDGVPHFFAALEKVVARCRAANLAWLGTGADRVDPGVMESLRRSLPDVSVSNRYGITDIPSAISMRCVGPGDSAVHWDNVGSAGDHLRVGVTAGGELEVEHAGATGPIPTGDIAQRESDGTLRILGRSGSLLKRHGFTFAPELIERAALMHPLVSDCRARFEGSQPQQELLLELVGGPLDESDFRSYLAGMLPEYAVPDRVRAVSTLERTHTGKIRRAP